MSVETEALDTLRTYGRALRSGDDQAVRHARVAVELAALKLVPEVYRDPQLARASEHLQQASRYLEHTGRTTSQIMRAK